MARQNIYDDECFFEGYKKIRQNEINANTLFEIPELFALLPDLMEKQYWIWVAVLGSTVQNLWN